jgi:DNA processing protein
MDALALQLLLGRARNRSAQQPHAAIARTALIITSGLALGIDAGHEGALAANGAWVSEFPRRTAPLRANSARRNRIISVMCLGTLAVEAAQRSGSLMTARLAAEQGRAVFAIPGSIRNPLSHGCHALIRSGAKLVESVEDIFDEIEFYFAKQDDMWDLRQAQSPVVGVSPLDKGYEILLDALGFEPASVDSLVERTGLGSQSVASMLLILELQGAVGVHGGGRYIRL